jgi:MFS family permease
MSVQSEGAKKSSPGVVLFMLVLVYAFNFIDRQIVSILAAPIQKELGLSDGELGLMGGLAFALFYTAVGIPIAWLADRGNRTSIIATALVVWSGFSAACGLATNFWQLFLARMGVGVGEAGGVAPSYSLIADYFPPEKRARALAIFSFGIPIGSAFGVLFGGLIAHAIGWRTAFIVTGLAGVLVAPFFKLLVREPARGAFDAPSGASAEVAPPFSAVMRELLAKPSFWFLALAASASSTVGYGLAFWLPSFYARSLDLGLIDRSLFHGSQLLFAGMAGIWLGGLLGDKLAVRSKKYYALVPMACWLLTAPLFAAAVLSDDVLVAYLLFFVPNALCVAWLGPVMAAVQHLVAPRARAVASSIFLFLINLIGLGGGTYVLGWMSDRMAGRLGDESLRYSILIGLSAYLAAALFAALASRSLARDWR